MKNLKQTIRKIISFLNNPDEEGGFWLPNIQRPFVWSETQICRLFDSDRVLGFGPERVRGSIKYYG